MRAYWKDLFREIKNTPGRFISLIIIALLGAASVVGIQATSIDMRDVADRTYKEHNLYDLQIKSSVGFDRDDIAALSGTAGVSAVMPASIIDVFINIENENRAVRTYSLPDIINTIDILDGRLPVNGRECVVESRLFEDGGIHIGDGIQLSLDDVDDYGKAFADDTFTVVGVVSSPLYISFGRGNTTLGDGSLRYYVYLHPDAYKSGVYTDVYVLMEGSHGMDNLTGAYYTAADGWKRQLEQAGALRAEAKKEVLKAQGMLAPAPEWFVFTREDGVSFDSYYQDTCRLEKIGYVFPLVFLLVAIMVSLTSMTRMVEDHRTQIGIYKALGYRPAAIVMKYLVYAFSASGLGGIMGAILGSWMFPRLIADAYSHLYNMPPVRTPIPLDIAAIAVLLSVLAIMLVTLLTYMTSMRGNPAVLMRPKPPAKGKRVLLERAAVIWTRLGFFSKVTARNTFRYKKRFLMTLAGIAGCSALLLTAFGLRDSIGCVGDRQYTDIVKYDARAYLKDITTDGQRDELNELLPGTHLFIREESVTANGTSGGLPASLLVPDTPESLNEYIHLYAPQSKDRVAMTAGSVLITGKLARVMGVGAGDSFTVTMNDGRTYTAEVTGIVDNYIQHFVYMSPAVYSELFGEEPLANGVMIYCENGWDFAAPLLENENVRALIHNDEIKSRVGEQADAMGVVTVVLIVLACALAFVVLFNLSNINISERTRELATIKVLGFYDNELSMYVFRENGIVVALGILLGLAGGIFLHGFVLDAVEIDILKFPHIIRLASFVIAVVLSLAFSVFVSLVMNIKLAKIDMVESLKNVE